MSNRELRPMPSRITIWLMTAGMAGMCWRASAAEPGPAANAPLTTGPTTRYVISNLGAVADGKTINTSAIQKVIDDAAAHGGGTVVVPAGTFRSGAIFLKPGVGLYVEKDGVLKGSTDVADYPMMRTWIEGHYQQFLPALVNADGVDHLRIGGPGTLDGSGKIFYGAFHSRFKADKTTQNLDVPRPRLAYISNCADVRVEGLHFLDSGFWNLHLFHSHDVLIDGLDIESPVGSPSTDGIDVDSSQSVTIHGCHIANNDDGIAMKGAKGPTAMDEKDIPPDEHIHIYDCEFDHGDSFVTCGSEVTVVRDLELDHCKSVGGGPRMVLRLKLRSDTPQLYENINFHDITLAGGRGAILDIAPWSMYEDLQGHPRPTHTVRNISISNVTGKFGSFAGVRSNPGDVIQNITLKNIDVQVSNAKPTFKNVSDLHVENVKLNGQEYTP